VFTLLGLSCLSSRQYFLNSPTASVTKVVATWLAVHRMFAVKFYSYFLAMVI